MPFIDCRHVAIEAEDYHKSEGWPHSKLKYLPGEPELFYGRFILKRPEWQESFRETSAMRFGTAGHAWFLEDIEPIVATSDVLSSSGSRAGKRWEAFAAAHDGDVILTEDEWAALSYAKTRAKEDPEVDAYLSTEGVVEHSLYATDEATGLPVRGRLDKIPEFADGLEILDLKFSGNTDPAWVAGQVAKMGYYRQAAFYQDLVLAMYGKLCPFTFLFVRNVPPYDSLLYRIYQEDVDLGRQENQTALLTLKDRLRTGFWYNDGYAAPPGYVHLPKWFRQEKKDLPAGFTEIVVQN